MPSATARNPTARLFTPVTPASIAPELEPAHSAAKKSRPAGLPPASCPLALHGRAVPYVPHPTRLQLETAGRIRRNSEKGEFFRAGLLQRACQLLETAHSPVCCEDPGHRRANRCANLCHLD